MLTLLAGQQGMQDGQIGTNLFDTYVLTLARIFAIQRGLESVKETRPKPPK